MKRPFFFLMRLIGTIILYARYIPRFLGRLLECAWHFNFDAFNRPWYFYHVDERDFIWQHFYYKTGWDYLIGNKVLVRDYWNEHLDRLFEAAGFKNLEV